MLPLGGGSFPIVDPAEVQKMTNVQVFNTKAISICVAEMCVALGLSHSPVTYPRGKLTYQDFVCQGLGACRTTSRHRPHGQLKIEDFIERSLISELESEGFIAKIDEGLNPKIRDC